MDIKPSTKVKLKRKYKTKKEKEREHKSQMLRSYPNGGNHVGVTIVPR
jgi:hypothetical protein